GTRQKPRWEQPDLGSCRNGGGGRGGWGRRFWPPRRSLETKCALMSDKLQLVAVPSASYSEETRASTYPGSTNCSLSDIWRRLIWSRYIYQKKVAHEIR